MFDSEFVPTFLEAALASGGHQQFIDPELLNSNGFTSAQLLAGDVEAR